MTRTHQLETTLRSLKLSGMLETLESRLAQAHTGELGHVEFLQSLCEDELSRRDAAGIVRRVRAARFEQVSAMEDFDINTNPKIPTARIRDLATLRFVEAGESVILHGPVGVGKTMVAQASVTRPVAVATPHCSPRPVGSSPISPEDMPTTPGRPGSNDGRDRPF
jgi:DNA replication protein DnaC